jgi:molybdenum-dependent DNA-binding transcriptional regulator ModE
MKRSHLAIALSIGSCWLTGCGLHQSISDFRSAPEQPAAAHSLSPSQLFLTARQKAWEAALLVQHPPHSIDTWQEARVKWRQAIRLIEEIPEDAPISTQAKQRLAVYKANYQEISQRLTDEQAAVDNFTKAQTLAWQAAVTVQKPPYPLKVWQRASQKWGEAISLLQAVPPHTSLTAKAKERLALYRSNQAAINQRITTEEAAKSTLQEFSEAANRLNNLQISVVKEQNSEPLGIPYEDYCDLVRSLRTALNQLEQQPGGKEHPAYADLATTIADYEFALHIWESYLNLKQANAWWLFNSDFYNQLVPLSEIDSDTLLQRYNVKISQRAGEAKIPLKFTLWEIWEQARQRVYRIQQKVASLT